MTSPKATSDALADGKRCTRCQLVVVPGKGVMVGDQFVCHPKCDGAGYVGDDEPDVHDLPVAGNDDRQHVLERTCWCRPRARNGMVYHRSPAPALVAAMDQIAEEEAQRDPWTGAGYVGEEDAVPEWNGRACPYFARYMNEPGHDPDAVCAFGCVDEPSCVTDQPRGGWPPLADGSTEAKS